MPESISLFFVTYNVHSKCDGFHNARYNLLIISISAEDPLCARDWRYDGQQTWKPKPTGEYRH